MDDAQKIWRYLTFSRFVWLLQKKSLWLARVDTFSDPWEVSLTQSQIELLASRHPVSMLDSPNVETSLERAKRINALWRGAMVVSPHQHSGWGWICEGKPRLAAVATPDPHGSLAHWFCCLRQIAFALAPQQSRLMVCPPF